jgi:hypothetical protein
MADLASVKDFAEACGVSAAAVYKAARHGRIGIHNGMIDIREKGTVQYATFVNWQRRQAQRQRGISAVASAPQVVVDHYLNHFQAIVLVNDFLEGSLVDVESSALADPILQAAAVKKILKAVRAAKDDEQAKKAVIRELNALARSIKKALEKTGLFLKHYCMETDSRWDYVVSFKPDKWDRITTTSYDLEEDAEEEGPA